MAPISQNCREVATRAKYTAYNSAIWKLHICAFIFVRAFFPRYFLATVFKITQGDWDISLHIRFQDQQIIWYKCIINRLVSDQEAIVPAINDKELVPSKWDRNSTISTEHTVFSLSPSSVKTLFLPLRLFVGSVLRHKYQDPFRRRSLDQNRFWNRIEVGIFSIVDKDGEKGGREESRNLKGNKGSEEIWFVMADLCSKSRLKPTTEECYKAAVLTCMWWWPDLTNLVDRELPFPFPSIMAAASKFASPEIICHSIHLLELLLLLFRLHLFLSLAVILSPLFFFFFFRNWFISRWHEILCRSSSNSRIRHCLIRSHGQEWVSIKRNTRLRRWQTWRHLQERLIISLSVLSPLASWDEEV